MSSEEIGTTIKELIRLSLVFREYAGFGSQLTTTAIQKVLYELKRQLPDNNPIKERLPYYWFMAGPFSEFVATSLDDMRKEGMLKCKPNQDYALYVLNRDHAGKRLCPHDEHFKEARELLNKIISKLRPFSIEQEIRAQYEDDAPSLFYPRYKLQFLPNIKLYFDALTNPARKTANFHPENQKDCLIKLLSVSTSSLPFNSVFSEFKKNYFDFEVGLDRLLKMDYKKNPERYVRLLQQAVKLSEDIWNTFAYGARIVKHDKPYDSRIPEWKKMFDEKINELSVKVGEFYKTVLDDMKGKEINENYLSLSEFSDMIIKSKEMDEISFINFSQTQIGERIAGIVEKLKDIPEFSTFIETGFLDYSILNKLSNDELKEIIKKIASPNPIYVAFSKKGEIAKTWTYRLTPNSLSSGVPMELLS
jgi:hypothetical protein